VLLVIRCSNTVQNATGEPAAAALPFIQRPALNRHNRDGLFDKQTHSRKKKKTKKKT
jgi:hypothetical protein